MNLDHLFVPGQMLVSFRTRPRGPLSWFGIGAEQQGVVCTAREPFLASLRRFHAMPQAERDRSGDSIAASLHRFLAHGLPTDGQPRPDMDADIVLAFGLRLIDGVAFESKLPVHRLGIMLRSADDIGPHGIPVDIVAELKLKV